MRALLSKEVGGPDTLAMTELPDPQAGPGQVVIAVRACAINYPDVLIIEDKYQFKPPRPFAPGGEIAGEVELESTNVADVGLDTCLRIVCPRSRSRSRSAFSRRALSFFSAYRRLRATRCPWQLMQ